MFLWRVKRPYPPFQKCSIFHHAVVQKSSETQISPMLFSWEHLKYQNWHPGAHFGTSLGGSWGGWNVPWYSCWTIMDIHKICRKFPWMVIFILCQEHQPALYVFWKLLHPSQELTAWNTEERSSKVCVWKKGLMLLNEWCSISCLLVSAPLAKKAQPFERKKIKHWGWMCLFHIITINFWSAYTVKRQ